MGQLGTPLRRMEAQGRQGSTWFATAPELVSQVPALNLLGASGEMNLDMTLPFLHPQIYLQPQQKRNHLQSSQGLRWEPTCPEEAVSSGPARCSLCLDV